jgi:phage baseplate assembly protein W
MNYWKDIDMELRMKSDSDILDMTNYDAITNSLINIFNTMQGSRRMLPDFALPIYRLLFEPIDITVGNDIGEMVLMAIERWEPRIVVESININVNPDANQYEATLYYYIVSESTGNIQTFSTILQAR